MTAFKVFECVWFTGEDGTEQELDAEEVVIDEGSSVEALVRDSVEQFK